VRRKRAQNRLASLSTALWFIAASLALAAADVKFVRTGDIAWEVTAAGLFLLAMGIGSIYQGKRHTNSSTSES